MPEPPPAAAPGGPGGAFRAPPTLGRNAQDAAAAQRLGPCPRLAALLAALFPPPRAARAAQQVADVDLEMTTASPGAQHPSLQTSTNAWVPPLAIPNYAGSPLRKAVSPLTAAAIIFPGLHQQTVGLGAAAVDGCPAAHALFDEASRILNYDLLDVCLHGPQERLDDTRVASVAVYVASLAAAAKLRRDQPHVVQSAVAAAGLGVGEYAALTFAGVLPFADGVRLVHAAYAAMADAAGVEAPTPAPAAALLPRRTTRATAAAAAAAAAPAGSEPAAESAGMLSIVGLSHEQVSTIVDEVRRLLPSATLAVSARLFPMGVTLSGEAGAPAGGQKLASSRGASKAIRLPDPGGFHSTLMQPAAPALVRALSAVSWQPPPPSPVHVFSNATGGVHDLGDPARIQALLLRQLTEPLQWESILGALCDSAVPPAERRSADDDSLATAITTARASLPATPATPPRDGGGSVSPTPPPPPPPASPWRLVAVSHTPHAATMVRRVNPRAWRTRGVAVDI